VVPAPISIRSRLRTAARAAWEPDRRLVCGNTARSSQDLGMIMLEAGHYAHRAEMLADILPRHLISSIPMVFFPFEATNIAVTLHIQLEILQPRF